MSWSSTMHPSMANATRAEKHGDKALRRLGGYAGAKWVVDRSVLPDRWKTEEVLTTVGAIDDRERACTN